MVITYEYTMNNGEPSTIEVDVPPDSCSIRDTVKAIRQEWWSQCIQKQFDALDLKWASMNKGHLRINYYGIQWNVPPIRELGRP